MLLPFLPFLLLIEKLKVAKSVEKIAKIKLVWSIHTPSEVNAGESGRMNGQQGEQLYV